MVYPIFPVSPVPADLSRAIRWGGNHARYDSGAAQGLTPYAKPLYDYGLGFRNINETKRDQIVSLTNSVKGKTFPFWFPDPYDYVNSNLVVESGIAAGSVFIYDLNSFQIRPASLQVQTLSSALSGYVTNGTEFNYHMESGYITLVTKASTDVWGVRSLFTLFKKCFFKRDYSDQSQLWNIWQSGLEFSEQL
jgi:hypothetical protein